MLCFAFVWKQLKKLYQTVPLKPQKWPKYSRNPKNYQNTPETEKLPKYPWNQQNDQNTLETKNYQNNPKNLKMTKIPLVWDWFLHYFVYRPVFWFEIGFFIISHQHVFASTCITASVFAVLSFFIVFIFSFLLKKISVLI